VAVIEKWLYYNTVLLQNMLGSCLY